MKRIFPDLCSEYFQDDVDVLALYYSVGDIVKKSIDEHDSTTFRPQRLNITMRIPDKMADDFRDAVPDQFKDASHIPER